MVMRLLKPTLLALAVYLVFILAYLPAAQVLARLPLPTKLQFWGVSGTLWHGHAQQVSYQGLSMDNLSWQLNPLGLLVGQARVRVTAGNSRDPQQLSLDGQVSAHTSGFSSDGLTLYLPADLVMAQLPLPLPVDAGGRFKVALDTLEYGPNCQQLQGKGQWLNAQVSGSQGAIALGNFDADLRCENGSVVLTIKEPNRFGLSADARIAANFKINVSGKFKPDPSLPAEVHNAAKLFGKPDSQGYYQIRF